MATRTEIRDRAERALAEIANTEAMVLAADALQLLVEIEGLTALRATIDNLHTTIESQAEETAQVVAENDALRAEVARLREACEKASAWIDDLYEWEHEGRQEYHKREIVDMLRAALEVRE